MPLMPDPTAERYQGAAGERYQRSKREIPAAALPWVVRARAKKFQVQIGPADVVLEYGVGYGWNLAGLRCGRKIGFDLTSFLGNELARQGIEFVPATSGLPSAGVDVVLCHHVMEHILSPPVALDEMRRLLKPAGRLLLTVPSERSSRRETFNPAEPNHHLYTWTVQTLGNLVADCGFKVTEARRAVYGYDRFAATRALKLRLGEPGFRFLRRTLQLLRPLYEVRLIASPSTPS